MDAKGSGNLLPKRLEESLGLLKTKGAQKVIILTDLDEDACITFTKNRITIDESRLVIVAIKNIESWFLADSFTLSNLLKEKFEFEKPENEKVPFENLKNIFSLKPNRGIGSKVLFTVAMIKSGFSINNAAKNPNCQSAAYFLAKLEQIAKNN